MPAELIKGNEEIRQETIANFMLVVCIEVGRWHGNVYIKQLNNKPNGMMHVTEPVSYREGDLVLLSTSDVPYSNGCNGS